MFAYKTLIILIAAFFTNLALADVPYMTNNTASSSERVQVGDVSCDSSKPQSTINIGAYGNNGNRYSYEDSDKGGFVSISIPIGESAVKTDCSRLYDLGVKMKEVELKQREMAVAAAEENLRLQQQRALDFK